MQAIVESRDKNLKTSDELTPIIKSMTVDERKKLPREFQDLKVAAWLTMVGRNQYTSRILTGEGAKCFYAYKVKTCPVVLGMYRCIRATHSDNDDKSGTMKMVFKMA